MQITLTLDPDDLDTIQRGAQISATELESFLITAAVRRSQQIQEEVALLDLCFPDRKLTSIA